MPKKFSSSPAQEARLLITDIADSGSGIAEAGISGRRMRVFVPGGLPGDTVLVRITPPPKGGHSASAEILEIAAPAEGRRPARCSCAASCGGCPLTGLSSEAQLAFKQKKLQKMFADADFADIRVEPALAMPPGASLRYRNKSVLYFSGKAEGLLLGMYRPGSHEVLPETLSCPVCPEWMEKAASAALFWGKSSGLHAFSSGGTLRAVLMREGSAEGRLFTLIVSETPEKEALESLCRTLFDCGVTSSVLLVNTSAGNTVLRGDSRVLSGNGSVTADLAGLQFSVRPQTFLQVNTAQTLPLYETALSLASITSEDEVLDLYCGIGTITLLAARRAKSVTGVEIVPESIEEARKNAAENGIANASFFCGAAESVLPELVRKGIRPRIVLVDPPRKGLEKTVPGVIASVGPEKIVYIACGPEALVRDAVRFRELGYRLCRVIPADLFPDTAHIETVALFLRTDSVS